MHEVARCRGCGARIIWATTTNAKKTPVDADPVQGGNVVLHPVDGCPPLALVVTTEPQPGETRFVSHFVTCPSAERFRQR